MKCLEVVIILQVYKSLWIGPRLARRPENEKPNMHEQRRRWLWQKQSSSQLNHAFHNSIDNNNNNNNNSNSNSMDNNNNNIFNSLLSLSTVKVELSCFKSLLNLISFQTLISNATTKTKIFLLFEREEFWRMRLFSSLAQWPMVGREGRWGKWLWNLFAFEC